ncbi:MAG: hypothetical protein ACLPQS_01165 [Acidimicrobiales bacterium]
MTKGIDEDLPLDAPEADVQEEDQVVEEQQSFKPTDRRDDVPEADWYEQSIEETLDEEAR